jgi:hypothetical protein
MHEMHRQMYLAAIGIDTYMPRYHLSIAPQSIQCEVYSNTFVSDTNDPVVELHSHKIEQDSTSSSVESESASPLQSTAESLIADVSAPRSIAAKSVAADILKLLNNEQRLIEPFSLGIWRVVPGVLIIDARNISQALPTGLMLKNISRIYFGAAEANQLQEEVLRWPIAVNRFSKRTEIEAREQLQSWLVAEYERQPIKHLWLMGENASTYLMPENSHFRDQCFTSIQLQVVSLSALILPSLVEILNQPIAKRRVMNAISTYISAQHE